MEKEIAKHRNSKMYQLLLNTEPSGLPQVLQLMRYWGLNLETP